MISPTLNQLQDWSAGWLRHSSAMLQTIVPRLVTWSQPAGQWWGKTFSRDVLFRWADHWATLFQDSISDPPPGSKGKATGAAVALYSPQGTIQTLDRQAKGLFKVTDASDFRSHWPKNAYDVDLSETSVLAHGIAIHSMAPDDVQKEFVQHVLEVRKQGGYDPSIFQETRHILGQSFQPQNPQL
ncbi:MAG: hypothetical protein HQL07_01195 [Nitrospirae bacterium]|nr:hypothetical protein [Magnetococcales bacterium]HAT51519.1 hypothetical protein [Alphaproteobacteria bacterium]